VKVEDLLIDASEVAAGDLLKVSEVFLVAAAPDAIADGAICAFQAHLAGAPSEFHAVPVARVASAEDGAENAFAGFHFALFGSLALAETTTEDTGRAGQSDCFTPIPFHFGISLLFSFFTSAGQNPLRHCMNS
jgi:hypothetical protein